MAFARAVWKLLVGIKDLMVLIVMILFFALLYGALKQAPEPVHEGVLWVDLDGTIVEEPSRADPFLTASGLAQPLGEYRLSSLNAALERAKDDDRIKAVALDLDGFLGGGQSAIGEVGDRLDALRKSGKPVIAYATGYSDDAYQLAAHASEIWLNPMGTVAFAGPGGSNLYYAALFDRLGVTANMYRAGDYKAAVEPYTRTSMSDEARENMQALAGSMLEHWKDDVKAARPKAPIDRALSDPVGLLTGSDGDLADAALKAGLVDKLASRRDYEQKLAELGGKDREDGFKNTRLEDYIGTEVDRPSSGEIGVVTVAGTIIDGTAGPGTAAGTSIARAIEQAHANKNLKALVVRIDSPGGSATASERIRQAIAAVRADKIPVVVSVGNVAASGGYWIATESDLIMAEPSSITGSIGVFAILPSFEGTMAKLGIGVDGVKTTPLSGEPDLLGGLSPEANAILQAGVDGTYQRFLKLVAASRGMSVTDVDGLGGGRVYEGGEARQKKLVDQFGDLDDAIAEAAKRAKIDDPDIFYIERERPFRGWLAELLLGDDAAEEQPADALAGLAPVPEAMLQRAAADLESLLAGPTIQARCLACAPDTPLPRQRSANWLGRLLGL